MDRDIDERVRIRAYEIWEREGRCGDPATHWHYAEQELAGGAADQAKDGPPDPTHDTLHPDWMAALDSALSGFMRGVMSHRRRRRATMARSLHRTASRRNKTAA